jgi:hypothetical protein
MGGDTLAVQRAAQFLRWIQGIAAEGLEAE